MVLEFYRREDGDWSWRLIALNHKIVAVAGEGYMHMGDCVDMACHVIDNEVVSETRTVS